MFDRCLYFNINHLAWVVNRKWDETFKEFGLSSAHAYLLRVVLANPGLTQKEIGGILLLDKSTITRFVNTLEKKKLIKRTSLSDADAREQRVVPSPMALKMHAAIEQAGQHLYEEMQRRLGKNELQQLVGLARAASEKLG
ncbi:MAG TPA: MarR family transcriptional regulator [Gallionella sp.]|nr:MarR family transcriptional regulator [Gallionella sp.]